MNASIEEQSTESRISDSLIQVFVIFLVLLYK